MPLLYRGAKLAPSGSGTVPEPVVVPTPSAGLQLRQVSFRIRICSQRLVGLAHDGVAVRMSGRRLDTSHHGLAGITAVNECTHWGAFANTNTQRVSSKIKFTGTQNVIDIDTMHVFILQWFYHMHHNNHDAKQCHSTGRPRHKVRAG